MADAISKALFSFADEYMAESGHSLLSKMFLGRLAFGVKTLQENGTLSGSKVDFLWQKLKNKLLINGITASDDEVMKHIDQILEDSDRTEESTGYPDEVKRAFLKKVAAEIPL